MRHTRKELRTAVKLENACDYLSDFPGTEDAIEILTACILCVRYDMKVDPLEAILLWKRAI